MTQICSICGTIATAKNKLIPDFYTWAIVINHKEENGEKQLLFFGLIGGGGGAK